MRTRILIFSITILAAAMTVTATAQKQCFPWGANTLRGDVQGLLTGKGVIEISPPDGFVYAIIDGNLPAQQFVQIKAGLRNRIADRAMGTGTVTAIARYRVRNDYENDLSAEPPTKESVPPTVSLSISAPVAITSVPSDTPEVHVFDFSAEPVPAGITDLFFLVLFVGEIQGVDGDVAAIGVKDLNEPHHHTPWNNSDYFMVNHQLHTGQEIRSDPVLMDYIDDHCWHMVSLIDPVDLDIFVGFTPELEDTPVYVAEYQAMPSGRFGRVIFLTESEEFNIHVRSYHDSGPSIDLTHKWPIGGVTNQVTAKGFDNTVPYTFRTIRGHNTSAFIWSCPAIPYSQALYDEVSSKAPASIDPVPVTILTFP